MINQRILDSIEDIFIPISSVLLISTFIANSFKFYFTPIIKSTYHLREMLKFIKLKIFPLIF